MENRCDVGYDKSKSRSNRTVPQGNASDLKNFTDLSRSCLMRYPVPLLARHVLRD